MRGLKKCMILSFVFLISVQFVFAVSNVQHSVNGDIVTINFNGTPPFFINIRKDQNIGQLGGYLWAVKSNLSAFTFNMSFANNPSKKFYYGVKDSSWSSTKDFFIGVINNTINCEDPLACEDYNASTVDLCEDDVEVPYCFHLEMCGEVLCPLNDEYTKCIEGVCRFKDTGKIRNLDVAFLLLDFNNSNQTNLTSELFEQYYVPRFKEFWLNNSNGNVSFNSADVYGRYELPAECTTMSIENPGMLDIINALPKVYDKYLFIYNSPCSGGGLSYGSYAQIGYTEEIIKIEKQLYEFDDLDGTLNHEFGHMLMLGHSSLFNCPGIELNNSCTINSYGNHFDIMGSGGHRYIRVNMGGVEYYSSSIYTNAAQLYKKGWLSNEEIINVVQSGIYSVGSLKNNLNKPHAARFVYGSEQYFLEWRDFTGFDGVADNFVQQENSGLLMNILNSDIAANLLFYNPFDSILVDMSKDEEYWQDMIVVTLNEGETYTDPRGRFSFSVLDVQNDEIVFEFNKYV